MNYFCWAICIVLFANVLFLGWANRDQSCVTYCWLWFFVFVVCVIVQLASEPFAGPCFRI